MYTKLPFPFRLEMKLRARIHNIYVDHFPPCAQKVSGEVGPFVGHTFMIFPSKGILVKGLQHEIPVAVLYARVAHWIQCSCCKEWFHVEYPVLWCPLHPTHLGLVTLYKLKCILRFNISIIWGRHPTQSHERAT